MKNAHVTGVPPLLALPFLLALSLMCSGPASAATTASFLELDVAPENSSVYTHGSGTSDLRIKVVSPDRPERPDRPNLNLSLVIDKSGSMADQGKMEHARRAAHRLVERLHRGDILSIVVYDDRVRVVRPAKKVTDRNGLHRLIDRIYPGGRTNLAAGLEEGYRQARKKRKRGYVNRVLLLSDGLANVGITDPEALRRKAGAMSESGISVSTFGVGLDFDEDLLAAVAYGGGGSYYYIAHPGDMSAALAREFDMAAGTVATEVEIIIRLREGCRFDSAIGHRWKRKGDSVIIKLGDLAHGEQRTLITRLNIPTDAVGAIDVADVVVQYRDPSTGQILSRQSPPVSLTRVDNVRIYEEGFDDGVREERVLIESNSLADEAARRVDSGDRDKALSLLGRAAEILKSAAPSAKIEKELSRNRGYQDDIEGMDAMEPEEIKEIQKDQKFRSYRKMYQQ